MSGQFWLFQCNGCGKWCVKEVRVGFKNKTFNCFYCNKSTKVKKETIYGLALNHKGPYSDPKQATQMCQKLNEVKQK